MKNLFSKENVLVSSETLPPISGQVSPMESWGWGTQLFNELKENTQDFFNPSVY